MNAATELITSLQNMGVSLSINGDKIRVKAPAGVVTEDLRRALAERKPEIIYLLTQHDRTIDHANVIDLRAYLVKLCQKLPIPPEHLLRHYFTAEDVTDIRNGRYPDADALAAFIKTDPNYPFHEDIQK